MSFGYENKENVLNGLNLSIRPGETVAFVDPSGAGKTALCSLLQRFYEAADDAVAIDGIDVREMKLESLRSPIGIVRQEVFLFDGTIRISPTASWGLPTEKSGRRGVLHKDQAIAYRITGRTLAVSYTERPNQGGNIG